MEGLPLAIREIDSYVDAFGWDGPVRLFALVDSAALDVPEVAPSPTPLTAIEQDRLPQAETIEELLAQIAWPEQVDGCAVSVERVIVQRDDSTVIGPQEALTDPDRRDVRLTVGVLRSGETWCAVRFKGIDDVVESSDAVPGVIELLRATLD